MNGEVTTRSVGDRLREIAGPWLALEPVVYAGVGRLPGLTEFNGPPFVEVGVTDISLGQNLQNEGEIPKSIVVGGMEVEVRLAIADRPKPLAHTNRRRPANPGDSIGNKIGVGLRGTIGAQVKGNDGRLYALTARHVVVRPGQSDGETGVQPSLPDIARRRLDVNDCVIGRIQAPNQQVDSAIVGPVDMSILNPYPLDGVPLPSPDTPAVGLLVGKNSTGAIFLPISQALSAVGATLRTSDAFVEPSPGMVVVKTGATTHRTHGKIVLVHVNFPPWNDAFIAELAAEEGDSGAVGVTAIDASFLQLNGSGASAGEDGEKLDLSGKLTSGPIGALLSAGYADMDIESAGSSISVSNDQLDQFKLSLWELIDRANENIRITASAVGSPRSCRALPGSPERVPTRCKVVIVGIEENLESGGDPVEPHEDEGTPAPKPVVEEPLESKGECCTFGPLPTVTVSGAYQHEEKVALSLGPVTLSIEFQVEAIPRRADFERTGECWRGYCSSETIHGRVHVACRFRCALTASGTITVKGVRLPAGIEITRQTRFSLDPELTLTC